MGEDPESNRITSSRRTSTKLVSQVRRSRDDGAARLAWAIKVDRLGAGMLGTVLERSQRTDGCMCKRPYMDTLPLPLHAF